MVPGVPYLEFNFCEKPLIDGDKCFATLEKGKCSNKETSPNIFGTDIMDDNGNVNGINLHYIMGDIPC